MTKKTYFNWSTGKDSALAFYHISKDRRYLVERLVTSVNAQYDRVSMHGIRRELLNLQIAELGLPVITIELPEMVVMEEYERRMFSVTKELKTNGFECAAFGDIYLEELRKYREEKLALQGIGTCFPLWKRDTRELIREFINLGFKAITVSVSAEKLGEEFIGRVLDEAFLADLPAGVDPCGENGEFHTFCFAGPIFKNEIRFEIGERVFREYGLTTPNTNQLGSNDTVCTPAANTGFWFCDLLPV